MKSVIWIGNLFPNDSNFFLWFWWNTFGVMYPDYHTVTVIYFLMIHVWLLKCCKSRNFYYMFYHYIFLLYALFYIFMLYEVLFRLYISYLWSMFYHIRIYIYINIYIYIYYNFLYSLYLILNLSDNVFIFILGTKFL